METNKIIIDVLCIMMPSLKSFFMGDIAMCLSNLNNYVYYCPGRKIDHKIKPGDEIKPGGIVDKCLKSGITIIDEIDAKIFGFPYKVVATPILNEKNEIIGVFTISESVEIRENREQLKNIAQELSLNVTELNEKMESLTDKTKYISSISNNLKQKSEESKEQVNETNDVINLIKNIAYKTNLLGINASIEATRVGDAGAGFKVVSDEVRKLSVNTDNSIKQIEPIIKQVHSNSNLISVQITEVSNNAESIAILVNQTTSMVKIINEIAEKIDNLADSLSKTINK